MSLLYLCTVGTGTAGSASNVAEGIMRAIEKKKPDICALVPSKDEKSVSVADIVKEGIREELADKSPVFKLFSRTPVLELKGWDKFAHTKNACNHTVMNSA